MLTTAKAGIPMPFVENISAINCGGTINMATARSAIELKSQQKIYKTVTMKLRKDSGIPQALMACADKLGIPYTTYMQNVLV